MSEKPLAKPRPAPPLALSAEESALAKVPCQDYPSALRDLDMEPGNAGFLKDGEKSSIEIDVNSVPMVH